MTIASTELGATDPMAATQMDLLTVLMHEIGHRLGLDDVSLADSAHGLMAESLDVGTRRLPVAVSAGNVDDASDSADSVGDAVNDEVFYTLGASGSSAASIPAPTILVRGVSEAAADHPPVWGRLRTRHRLDIVIGAEVVDCWGACSIWSVIDGSRLS